MRRLLIWSLLVFTPFTGVRMICVDTPARTAATVDAGADCEQFCLRQKARAPEGPHGDIDCLLVAGGAVVMVVSGEAILPTPPAIRFVAEARPYELVVTDLYHSPALSLLSPPPKV